jgi:hypothetical protein
MSASRKSCLFMATISLLALSACEGIDNKIEQDARYWQRVDTTDAIYQQGPKAQQMLFTDIARCTAELNEMERLGALRNAIPADSYSDPKPVNPNSPEARMADWDTPERDGYMRAEHYEYHDFETCMTAKGWERTKFVNYETRTRSRDDYLTAIGHEKHRTKYGEREAAPATTKKQYND